jgi:hypothetical protein
VTIVTVWDPLTDYNKVTGKTHRATGEPKRRSGNDSGLDNNSERDNE